MRNEYVVAVDNRAMLPRGVYEEFEKKLAANNIHLADHQMVIKADLFNLPQVQFSPELTEIITQCLLMSFVYDILKHLIRAVYHYCKEFVLVLRKEHCIIYSVVPKNISDKEIDAIFDEINHIVGTIKIEPSKREMYVIEQNLSTMKLEIKTIQQYNQERIAIQKKGRACIMTREQLDEIKARCEDATPGPWRVYTDVDYDYTKGDFLMIGNDSGDTVVEAIYGGYDANFIANARQDIPALLEYISKLEEDCDTWKRRAEERSK